MTRSDLQKANIRLSEPFTLTTFPKRFAQIHADAGTPTRTLSKFLGHSDTRIILEFYNRVTDANRVQAAKTMDQLLGTARKTVAQAQ